MSDELRQSLSGQTTPWSRHGQDRVFPFLCNGQDDPIIFQAVRASFLRPRVDDALLGEATLRTWLDEPTRAIREGEMAGLVEWLNLHRLQTRYSKISLERSVRRIGTTLMVMADIGEGLEDLPPKQLSEPQTLYEAEIMERTSGQVFLKTMGQVATCRVLIVDGASSKSHSLELEAWLVKRVVDIPSDAALVQFPAGSCAFSLFDNDWLGSFDDALAAAQKLVGAADKVAPDQVGRGMGVCWNLKLLPFLQPLYDERFAREQFVEAVKRADICGAVASTPLCGGSASAAFALLTAQLLAQAALTQGD